MLSSCLHTCSRCCRSSSRRCSASTHDADSSPPPSSPLLLAVAGPPAAAAWMACCIACSSRLACAAVRGRGEGRGGTGLGPCCHHACLALLRLQPAPAHLCCLLAGLVALAQCFAAGGKGKEAPQRFARSRRWRAGDWKQPTATCTPASAAAASLELPRGCVQAVLGGEVVVDQARPQRLEPAHQRCQHLRVVWRGEAGAGLVSQVGRSREGGAKQRQRPQQHSLTCHTDRKKEAAPPNAPHTKRGRWKCMPAAAAATHDSSGSQVRSGASRSRYPSAVLVCATV